MKNEKLLQYEGICIDDTVDCIADDAFWIAQNDTHIFLQIFIVDISSLLEPYIFGKDIHGACDRFIRRHRIATSTSLFVPNTKGFVDSKTKQAICFQFSIEKETLLFDDFHFFESSLSVGRRYSYKEVDDFICQKPHTLSLDTVRIIPMIKKILEVSTVHRTNDTFWKDPFKEKGKFMNIPIYSRFTAHTLVQELMILTNIAVGNYAIRHALPLYYKGDRYTDVSVQRIRGSTKVVPLHPIYTTITSPLRSVPDFLNQVNICSFIRKNNHLLSSTKMERIIKAR